MTLLERVKITLKMRKMIDLLFEMDAIQPLLLSTLMGEVFESTKWMEEIPYISFPSHWEVKVLPHFGAAIARFWVREKGKEKDATVSVYLDCYDILGHFGEPYWEVYPHNDDVARCPMKDVSALLGLIEQGLKQI